MKKRVTKTEAIRHARENVSALSRFGDGWIYLTFDAKRNAWREHGPFPHSEAAIRRSSSLVYHAVQHATGSIDEGVDAQSFFLHRFNGGRWTDYVEVAS